MSIPGAASPLFLATTGAAAAFEISRSLRFNSGDSASLTRTPSSASNRTTWTWSGWVKRAAIGAEHSLFGAGTSASNADSLIMFDGSDHLQVWNYPNAYVTRKITTAVFRDLSAWYHVVVSCNGSTYLKIYVNGVEQALSTDTGPDGSNWYFNGTSEHSIGKTFTGRRFNGYLADVHFIDGQGALAPTDFGETNTDNLWVPKAYAGTYGTNGFRLAFADNSSNAALGTDTSGNSNTWTVNNLTAASNNWPNYVYAGGATYSSTETGKNFYTGNGADLFDGTLNNYVGGENVVGGTVYFRPAAAITGVTSIQLYGAYNGETRINGSVVTVSPAWSTSDQYVTVQSPPSSITEISVKGDTGSGSAARIKAIKANGSMLVDLGPTHVDSLVDTPTNGTASTGGDAGGVTVGNYCTQSPIDSNSGITLSNGNLDLNRASNSWVTSRGTIGITSGKYYWEAKFSSGLYMHIGIQKSGSNLGSYVGDPATGWSYSYEGKVYNNQVDTSYGNSYTTNDVIGVAFDADAGSIYFYKNGAIQNSGTAAYTGLTDGPYIPAISLYGTIAANINFGQRAFTHAAPSGYKSLNTANLSATIADGSQYFDTKLWTGNGTSQTISGLNFSPDLVWNKSRSTTRQNHLVDTVRGAGKRLFSDSTEVENSASTNLTAFNSDGFDLGSSPDVNQNGTTYSAWVWDAGTSTVTNNDGSIASQVRASAASGFSIIKYTGDGASNATLGHGLGAKPYFYIVKRRDVADQWRVYHQALGATKFLNITSDGAFTASTIWNNTEPTNSVFSIGSSTSVIASGGTYIAYCFAPVEGYSSVGSYVGNGNASGPFVYTGHSVAWVMIKRSDAADNWVIYDIARDTYNIGGRRLYPDLSNAEAQNTSHYIDILSNGFKVRSTGGMLNASGGTYIYLAFASHPFASNGGLAR